MLAPYPSISGIPTQRGPFSGGGTVTVLAVASQSIYLLPRSIGEAWTLNAGTIDGQLFYLQCAPKTANTTVFSSSNIVDCTTMTLSAAQGVMLQWVAAFGKWLVILNGGAVFA